MQLKTYLVVWSVAQAGTRIPKNYLVISSTPQKRNIANNGLPYTEQAVTAAVLRARGVAEDGRCILSYSAADGGLRYISPRIPVPSPKAGLRMSSVP